MDDQARKRKSESMHDNISLIDLASDSVEESSQSELNTSSTPRFKRINNNSGSSEIYFKILVPNYAAGGVIGKGGEKIAKIQKDLNVKIKMSKNNDYFPSTNERVCLMYGNIEQLLKVNDFVMEKINEKPDTKTFEEDRVNQIKIIVHHNMAGSLIGKGGCHIKQIKDESGAFVQITPKQNDYYERIMIIEGDKEKRNKALRIILKEFSEDSHYDNSEITNLIYNDMNFNHNNNHRSNNNKSSHNNNNNNNSMHHSHSNNKLDLNNVVSASGLLGTPNTNTLLLGLSKLNELIAQNNNTNNSSINNNNNNNNLSSSSSSSSSSNSTLQSSGLSNLAALIINCGGIAQLNSDNLTSALRNFGYGSTSISEIVDSISVLINYGLISKPNNNSNGNNISISSNSNGSQQQQGSGILGTPPQSLMNIPTSSLLSNSNSNTNLSSNATNNNNNNNNVNLLATLLGANNNNNNNNNVNSLASLLQMQNQNQGVAPLLQLLSNSLK